MLNIAEGSTRMSDSDQRRFYVMARSSLNEVNALFDHLEDINPDDLETLNAYRDQAIILSKMLLRLIRTLE
jgi:four helix bundle protein